MPKNKRPTAKPRALFSLEPEPPKQETPAPSFPQDAAQLVDQIMYSLTAPFIGYPGWGDDPSFWEPHKARITVDRLAHHLEIHSHKVAGEYETMLYLSSASLAAPMSSDWGQVYFYLFTRCLPEQAKVIGNEVTELDPGQREDLAQLRRWLYKQQMEHLKQRLKGGEKAPPSQRLEKADPQLELF